MSAKKAEESTEVTQQQQQQQHTHCVKRLEYSVAQSRQVHKLIDALQNMGCSIPSDFLVCRQCPPSISGGFAVAVSSSGKAADAKYKPQIVMCENGMLEKESFEHTLVHELVHAFDQCRSKIDWKNCLHHACTEVRASAISGECNLLHEIFRGNTKIRNGHQECVTRRATKSVKMNPYCQDIAADAVSAVFEACYRDKTGKVDN